jgi:hypothetical protein
MSLAKVAAKVEATLVRELLDQTVVAADTTTVAVVPRQIVLFRVVALEEMVLAEPLAVMVVVVVALLRQMA